MGGITYSVPVIPVETVGDVFVLGIGAYRFSPDMHLPGDLIMKDLGRSNRVLCAEMLPYSGRLPAFNLLFRGFVGSSAKEFGGYVTPINIMFERMVSSGVQMFIRMELIDIDADQGEMH